MKFLGFFPFPALRIVSCWCFPWTFCVGNHTILPGKVRSQWTRKIKERWGEWVVFLGALKATSVLKIWSKSLWKHATSSFQHVLSGKSHNLSDFYANLAAKKHSKAVGSCCSTMLPYLQPAKVRSWKYCCFPSQLKLLLVESIHISLRFSWLDFKTFFSWRITRGFIRKTRLSGFTKLDHPLMFRNVSWDLWTSVAFGFSRPGYFASAVFENPSENSGPWDFGSSLEGLGEIFTTSAKPLDIPRLQAL